MATLFITIFRDATVTLLGRADQEMTITVAGASAQSSVVTVPANGAGKRLARLYTDTDCFVTWGTDPTATNDGSSGMPLGADNPEVISVETGDKFAAIERT